jgi:hypothetical protein
MEFFCKVKIKFEINKFFFTKKIRSAVSKPNRITKNKKTKKLSL